MAWSREGIDTGRFSALITGRYYRKKRVVI